MQIDVRWNGLYHVANDDLLILQGQGDRTIKDSAQGSFWWGGSTVALQVMSSASSANLYDAV